MPRQLSRRDFAAALAQAHSELRRHAPGAPGAILPRQAEHQSPDPRVGRWTTRAFALGTAGPAAAQQVTISRRRSRWSFGIAEPLALCMDEREPLPRRSVVDQRLRGLAQDLVLATQILNLTLTVTQLGTRLLEGGGEITTAQLTGHEPEPCRTLPLAQTASPNSVVPRTESRSPHDNTPYQQVQSVKGVTGCVDSTWRPCVDPPPHASHAVVVQDQVARLGRGVGLAHAGRR